MELINQEKVLLTKEVQQLKNTLMDRDQENQKLKDKLKHTERVVTELTQSMNKVMTENYRRTNSSTLLSKDQSPTPKDRAKLSLDGPNSTPFRRKKESMPV